MMMLNDDVKSGEKPEASPLALRITGHPRFRTSDGDTEKAFLTNAIQDDAYTFVKDATFHLEANDQEYWAALETLEDAIMPHIVDYIL